MIWYKYTFECNMGLVPNEDTVNRLTVEEGWELVDWQTTQDAAGAMTVTCFRRPAYFTGPDGKKDPPVAG